MRNISLALLMASSLALVSALHLDIDQYPTILAEDAVEGSKSKKKSKGSSSSGGGGGGNTCDPLAVAACTAKGSAYAFDTASCQCNCIAWVNTYGSSQTTADAACA
jgi:hypothetical protein